MWVLASVGWKGSRLLDQLIIQSASLNTLRCLCSNMGVKLTGEIVTLCCICFTKMYFMYSLFSTMAGFHSLVGRLFTGNSSTRATISSSWLHLLSGLDAWTSNSQKVSL